MSIFALTCFITGIIAGVTGSFVFLKERRQKLNQIWCFFNFAIAIWMVGLGGTLVVNDRNIALFCQRILYVGTILIPILFFQFCVVFIEKERERKFITFFKINVLLVIIFTSFLFFGDFFIKNVKNQTDFGYWPVETGWLYYPFLLWFAFNVIYPFFLLRNNLKGEIDAIKRKQTSIIFYGTLIGFIAGSVNFLLDFNIVFPPFHNLFVISYLFFVAFAVTRYHLFNIRLILTEMLVIATGLTLLVQAVVAETLLLKVLGGILFGVFLIFGYQLVRSVIKEIELRTQLKQAYDELERIDKAKTEFLSIASHQLRTPLTAVKGYISLILEKSYGEFPEKMKKPLENVFASNERLVKLVNELLNITRLEMGRIELNLEKTHLEEMISSIVEELKITAENKGLYLKLEKPEIPLPETSVDKDKIRQVVLNLVDNAIKYTKEGGITIQLKIEDSKSKIVISDTGVGMEKEEIDKLFDIMVRGKAGAQYWTEGAGLGLYIARKFVEMHGGKVWAESEGRGKGSAFLIELPIK
jgi:signal transduction histidine kinase